MFAWQRLGWIFVRLDQPVQVTLLHYICRTFSQNKYGWERYKSYQILKLKNKNTLLRGGLVKFNYYYLMI